MPTGIYTYYNRFIRIQASYRFPVLTALLIILCFVFMGCERSKNYKFSDVLKLKAECSDALLNWRYEECDSLSRLLMNRARQNGDKVTEALALYYLGSFRRGEDNPNRLTYLQKAEEIAHELRNDTLLSRITNAKGCREMEAGNFGLAAHLFNEARRQAETKGARRLQAAAEINLSEVYRLLRDTLGMEYDHKLFEYAGQTGNDALLFSSALHCLLHIINTPTDTTNITPYTDALRQSGHFPEIIPSVFTDYYLSRGELSKAGEWAVGDTLSGFFYSSVVRARWLNAIGKYNESATEAAIGIAYPEKDLFEMEWPKLLLIDADNQIHLGNRDLAYNRLLQYIASSDSINELIHSQTMERYKIEYQVAKKDAIIATQRERQTRLLRFIIIASIWVIVIFVSYVAYTRRRQAYWRNIVKQQRAAIDTENELRQRLAEAQQKLTESTTAPGEQTTVKSISSTSMSDNKIDSIWEQIRHEAEENEIWRDLSLTRESFAALVGCNRTYFSEVIKAKTGKSYTQYLNGLRVHEAVKILSQPDNDVPLKELAPTLGFMSLNWFNTIFKQEVGLSPTAFRKTVKDTEKA